LILKIFNLISSCHCSVFVLSCLRVGSVPLSNIVDVLFIMSVILRH